jgi:hypothetical protein
MFNSRLSWVVDDTGIPSPLDEDMTPCAHLLPTSIYLTKLLNIVTCSDTKKEGSNLRSRPSDPWRHNSTRLGSDILHIHRSTPQRSSPIYRTPDPQIHKYEPTTRHRPSKLQTSCFVGTHTHLNQKTNPFNIYKVITLESTSSPWISSHRAS